MFGFIRKIRRRKIRDSVFPPEWLEVLEKDVPLYRRLPPGDREELKGHILVLVEEKSFEGCGGLAVTDRMRIMVLANAAILLLRRDTDYFPGLASIVLYPRTYVGRYRDIDDAGVITDGVEERLGESWQEGTVVLSWRDVLEDSLHGGDGFNVTIHEFAHQLDAENGATEGIPRFRTLREYREFSAVFSRDYERFCSLVDAGEETAIDPYGAEHPSEFFAVLTEAFFDTPQLFREEFPELYRQFALYFSQDPEGWGS